MSKVRDPFQRANDHICPAKATIKVASVQPSAGGPPDTFQVTASFIIRPLCPPSCPAPLPRILRTMDNEVQLQLRSTCTDHCQWAERDSGSSDPPVISPPLLLRQQEPGRIGVVMCPNSGGTLGFVGLNLISKVLKKISISLKLRYGFPQSLLMMMQCRPSFVIGQCQTLKDRRSWPVCCDFIPHRQVLSPPPPFSTVMWRRQNMLIYLFGLYPNDWSPRVELVLDGVPSRQEGAVFWEALSGRSRLLWWEVECQEGKGK